MALSKPVFNFFFSLRLNLGQSFKDEELAHRFCGVCFAFVLFPPFLHKHVEDGARENFSGLSI